ncbi:MFS transporter [Streptomyces sp. NPDC003077]|uniref:MFS transporter n=1 Tax=Streptomyces sp. NPDC003077 TaxID=3154443 RepID=UPI0033AFC6D7
MTASEAHKTPGNDAREGPRTDAQGLAKTPGAETAEDPRSDLSQPSGPHDPYPGLAPRRRVLVTVALLGCAFLAMLDGTVVGTALPRIVEQVGGGGSWYVWLVTAYLLTSSVSVPVYGRFSDLHGRRRLLLGGLALFLGGSLACGLSGTIVELVVARAVQGAGAGALLTLGMALVRDLFPPGRSGGLIRMQTALGAMMVLGMVGGPLIGGALTDHVGWRWAFWLNLPIGLAAALVIAFALPERRPAAVPSGRLDVAGILLLTTGLSLVLIGFSLKGHTVGAQTPAWTDPRVVGPVLGGVAALALLVAVERRAAVPVLPLRLFRHRGYAALLSAGFFFQVAVLPAGVFLPLYFQDVRGHSATVSGLLLLPLLVGMTLGNRLTAAVILRGGRVRPSLLTGAGLLTAGTAAFFALDASTPPLLTSVWLLVAGLGTGPAMGGLTIATQNCVPYADMGSATAGAGLTKQLGGAFGLACGQSLMAGHVAGAVTAPAVGSAVAWLGGVAGLLALAALLLMPEIRIPTGHRPAPGPRTVPQPASSSDSAG